MRAHSAGTAKVMSGSILFRIRGSSRSPPARLAGPTFICSGLPADDGIRRYPGPREHGGNNRARIGSDQPQRGRPRGRAIHHQLLRVLVLQEGHALCLRPHQSERRDGDQGDGPIAGRLFGFSPMLDGYSGGHAEWNGVSDPVKKAIKLPLCI